VVREREPAVVLFRRRVVTRGLVDAREDLVFAVGVDELLSEIGIERLGRAEIDVLQDSEDALLRVVHVAAEARLERPAEVALRLAELPERHVAIGWILELLSNALEV
jgi:hypothetical protein